MQEVAALDHKGLDDAVELGVLVAEERRGGAGAVADAELAEIFGGQRDGGGVEKHFDAAERFACGNRDSGCEYVFRAEVD